MKLRFESFRLSSLADGDAALSRELPPLTPLLLLAAVIHYGGRIHFWHKVMVQWQRHILPILRHIGKRPNPANEVIAATTVISRIGQVQTAWRMPLGSMSRPFWYNFQHQGIASSTKMLANSSEETPVSSPLTPVLSLGSGKTEDQKQKAVVKPSKVQAVLKGIKQSPKKVNLVAALVRGMRVEDALLQLQVTVKRACKTVYQVIHSARANASHNHGMDPDRLIVAEAFVGKGFFKKRVSYHSKGRCGVKVRPECRLTVVVREITPEEEAEIARLRVHNFRKLTKRERRLVPHQLIETTSIWGRKNNSSGQDSSATATA
ncbi:uncharacterized protein LOC129285018 isoform X2 [Prosopis cineraria]|uniref:uncharacterized protein LOC129285018 isoform X2 n=1 Tax=Prosopis cineraria TaxID=364024 RepID=UPI00240FD2B4|nr:uncharacterized protein LOC129285018 isoform X2 [Prosopis cineraria]